MPSIEQLEKLLSAEPDDAFLNFGLAMELARQNRVEDALTRFDRVIGLDPDYVAAYFQKARTLAGAGRIEESRRTLHVGIQRSHSIGNEHAAGEMSEMLASLG
jgi:predicted Zn-dependent protease